MFLLDSLMISGIRWTLETVITAARAEMQDDGALRERLMEAEMQREMGEITDEDYAAIEADLLREIRAIKERRDGGSSAFAFSAGQPIDTGGDGTFLIEAEVAGEFHEELPEPPSRPAPASPPPPPPRPARTSRSTRRSQPTRTARPRTRAPRTRRTSRPPRTK
jgi:hypothetical protein